MKNAHLVSPIRPDFDYDEVELCLLSHAPYLMFDDSDSHAGGAREPLWTRLSLHIHTTEIYLWNKSCNTGFYPP